MSSHRHIPSMFHRRLILLFAGMLLIFGVLTLQLMRLSVVKGRELRESAEAQLNLRSFLPTFRGEIIDRQGRKLALDLASYDVAIRYDLITGSWQVDQAARAARRELGLTQWSQLSPEDRDAAIEAALPGFEAQAQAIWDEVHRLGNLAPEEVTRRRDAVRAEVQSLAAAVWQQQQATWQDERQQRRDRAKFSALADEGPGFRPRPIREQLQAHVILPRVPDEVAYAFNRVAQQHPGLVAVLDSTRRVYPWSSADVTLKRNRLPRPLRSEEPITIRVDGVADHIVGAMREQVWAQDIRRRPFRNPATGAIDLRGYRFGDSVGAEGLEQVFEDHLRGRRGQRIERRDTGEELRTDPAPGADLHVTLDILLQARIQAILSPQFGLTVVQPWHHNPVLPVGFALNSAAVVVEVPHGEILAMVSMPTAARGRDLPSTRRKRDQPWINRPTEAVYPPGSIIKPLVLAAAVQSGGHHLADPIECGGHYFPDVKNRARCWIYRERYGHAMHGELLASEALARSCNIYFYTLADHLEPETLSAWFGRFGLGRPLQCGLLHSEHWPKLDADGQAILDADGRPVIREVWVGEAAGTLPGAEEVETMRRDGTLRFSSIIMGIGQGPVTWTPLQAANAYATLARGGQVRDATLVMDEAVRARPQARPDFPLPDDLVEAALEGLRQSVEEPHGTGYHLSYDEGDSERIINARSATVWGKTGTAQAPPARLLDRNQDGVVDEDDEPVTQLDHAWFVGLVGPERGSPLHAIAVVVEYGGSGGRVAGPVANQIIHALQDSHYLPGGEL